MLWNSFSQMHFHQVCFLNWTQTFHIRIRKNLVKFPRESLVGKLGQKCEKDEERECTDIFCSTPIQKRRIFLVSKYS